MNIGLMGAHRVGKTTLATAFSKTEEAGCDLILTDTSSIIKELRINLSQKMNFGERLALQRRILDSAVDIWSKAEGNFITDRTPLDFLAYTMADIGPDTPDTFLNEFEEYRELCYSLTNFFFSLVCLVQPGIEPVYEPYKAPLNEIYMTQFNTIIFGIMSDGNLQTRAIYLDACLTDLSERVAALNYSYEDVKEGSFQPQAVH